jgi:hypothetical protein
MDEILRATNEPVGWFFEKRDLGEKPKSLSLLRWCRRRDLNPHGFPHHPLKKPIVMPMEAIFVYKSPHYRISGISLLQ